MSCFGGNISPDVTTNNCCTATTMCRFDGNLRNVVSEPIFVQKVYDVILFNLQGLKTASDQIFRPNIPRGYRVRKVLEIRCKKYFNPENIDDPKNLKVCTETTISGASFVEQCGEPITVIGPDGTASQKILYTDSHECDEEDRGTSAFGTQNIRITGNVIVEMDVLVIDRHDCESTMTLCADVNIAPVCSPLILTNFFEICVPSTINSAFLPRFTEFCNVNCDVRLATNSSTRDICSDNQTGSLKANLIIAICVTCEKKIVVPVQLCVLSTGFVQLSPQISSICSSFPQLFPDQVDECSIERREDCSCKCDD
jgi:hypothetical protein